MTLLLFSTCCNSQSSDRPNSGKTEFSIFGGAGRSFFATNSHQSQLRFPTAEVALGVGAKRKLFRDFDAKLYLNVSGKIKGNRVYPPGSPVIVLSPPVNELDGTANGRNHYSLEVPLLIQFNVPKSRVGINTGVCYRYFFKNRGYEFSDGPDFLSTQNEFGVLAGITIQLTAKFRTSAQYYFGLTNVYNRTVLLWGSPTAENGFEVRNQFSRVAIEYIFQTPKRGK
jgi:hypothetical protein